MRRTATLATAVASACAACQPLPDATLAGSTPRQPQPAPAVGAQPPACSSYTVPLTVGGQAQQAVVEACQQADGSWRITQTTPGLPPQIYEVPAPASPAYRSGYSYPEAYAYPYPDFAPDWGWAGWSWGGAPWVFGLAPSIVVVQRFNHFHHGFHHGFAHGFDHGFGHGMHGVGHGFAAMHGGGIGGGHR